MESGKPEDEGGAVRGERGFIHGGRWEGGNKISRRGKVR